MFKTFLKTRAIKKQQGFFFVKHLKVMTTVNRFCHFVINKNHKMCPKRFFSGVDCRASYTLFFLWCRGTND